MRKQLLIIGLIIALAVPLFIYLVGSTGTVVEKERVAKRVVSLPDRGSTDGLPTISYTQILEYEDGK